MASSFFASSSLFTPPSTVPRLTPPQINNHEGTSSSQGGKAPAVSTSIDELKATFRRTVPALALRINASDVGGLRKGHLAQVLLNIPRISNVIRDPSSDPSKRLLLLDATELSDLPQEASSYITEQGFEILQHDVVITYDWYTADEVLAALLPLREDKGTPTAFSTIGHIAHLNLREEHLPFRYIIGQVILEKSSNIRTVVNKLDSIDTVYRFFDMELIAGEPDFTATVSESNCTMTFDFRKVYFNSRLHTEHDRLVTLLKPGQVVSDVMAGVGPFALPAAKNGCIVYANDLNPASYESLTANAKQNRVQEGCLTYCEDGRLFIKESVKRAWRREIAQWTGVKSSKVRSKEIRAKAASQEAKDVVPSLSISSPPPTPSRLIDHFIMNLPDSALEFLDAYRGAYKALAQDVGMQTLEDEIRLKHASGNSINEPWPMVHVHCFTKDLQDPHGDICNRANASLGLPHNHPDRLVPPPSHQDPEAENSRQRRTLGDGAEPAQAHTPTQDLSLHWVRAVAPNKDMWCLSFRLPRSVLFDDE